MTNETRMRAIVHERYGEPDVLRLESMALPALGEGDVLVRVHAASVNPADYFTLSGSPFLVRLVTGLTKPKDRVLGRDVAGRVEAVGPGVTRFRPGDEVFGELVHGAYAEYVA